jgi:hypothetical protein
MPSNFNKLVEARIAQTGEAWATAAGIIRSKGRGGLGDDPLPERADGLPSANGHPAHQGLISHQELDWVMDSATPPSANGDRSQASYHMIYLWLAEYRGGSIVPMPSYKMVRNSWSLEEPHPAARKWAESHGEV